MFGIGATEMWIFLAIVLVLFGGSRIPSVARSLGKSITEFKKGVQELKKTISRFRRGTEEEV